jgi:predicted porin
MKTFTKSILFTTSVLAASGYAHADGFKFYALLDGGIASSSISGAGTTASKTEFVTGGYAPNFAGITGDKSLGNGLTGGFNLEQGFLLNQPATGTSRFAFGEDALFNRNANLFVKGGFGTVTLGTQANIAFNSVLTADARFGSNYGSSLAAIVISGGLGTRDNGAVSYASPNFSGFSFGAEYVPETATVKSANRVAVNYGNGPLKATFANYTTDVIGATTMTTGNILGATYKIGSFDVKGLAAVQKNPTFSSLTTYGLGGAYFYNGEVTFDAGAYRTSDSGTDYKMDTFAVGVQYKFVKDLEVYAQYASVKNTGTPATPFNFAPPTLLTGNITAGQTASTFNVGLLYSFF